jgi:curli production assembly/transport component CsgG
MMKTVGILFILVSLSACSSKMLYDNKQITEAQVTDTTSIGRVLENLPVPEQRLPVVVYDFQDQTGQFKANDNFADYSSAVTKGAVSVLIKTLLDTSDGAWFMVAERSGLDSLLKERQIIRSMREEYTGPDGKPLPMLPPLIYGGMILEGGIIFYDSNILTGGAAAGYFGISGSTQYRRDIITVYLRAVDINSGEVILAVNSSKTVFSYGVNAGLTRYLSYNKLLEAEAGFTVNEPTQLAVRQAIEASVYSLIMEGALKKIWNFKNEKEGKKAIDDYLKKRDGKRSDDTLRTFDPAPMNSNNGGIIGWVDDQFKSGDEAAVIKSNVTKPATVPRKPFPASAH